MTEQFSSIDAATIKPKGDYQVVLSKPVTVAGVKIKPRGDITLRGDLLKTLIQEEPDAVLSVSAVA